MRGAVTGVGHPRTAVITVEVCPVCALMSHIGIHRERECEVLVDGEVISPVPVDRRCGCTLEYLVVIVEYVFFHSTVLIVDIVVGIVPYLGVTGLLAEFCSFFVFVFLPDAEELVVPDFTDGLVDEPTVGSIVIFLACFGIVVVVDVLDAVLVVGEAYAGAPFEVLAGERHGTESDFNTLVGHFTKVGDDAAEAGERRQTLPHDHVFGRLGVPVDATAETALEETEVKTYVECTCLFP